MRYNLGHYQKFIPKFIFTSSTIALWDLTSSSRFTTNFFVFVYEGNSNFTTYSRRSTEINDYMVDFRNVHKINCGLIKKTTNGMVSSEELIKSKVLQLTPTTRKHLREKISRFYFRPAQEDELLLED